MTNAKTSLFLLLIVALLFLVAPKIAIAESADKASLKCAVKGVIQEAIVQPGTGGERYLLITDIKEMKGCEGKYSPSVMGIYLNHDKIKSGDTYSKGEQIEGIVISLNNEIVFDSYTLVREVQKSPVQTVPTKSNNQGFFSQLIESIKKFIS